MAVPLVSLGADAPENLGLGLRQLVENYQNDQAQFRAKISSAKTLQADAANRVVANIHLNGTKNVEQVAQELEDLGLEIIAIDPNWRTGVISAWLPISKAVEAANLSGIRSVLLAPPPRHRAGSVTAESNIVERTQQVNAAGAFTAQGIRGANIRVGIVSDSYDKAAGIPRASAGIASGDLPGPGNPDGYTTPVVVLQDGSASDTDEGRGMAEIVHDLAPAAKMFFDLQLPEHYSDDDGQQHSKPAHQCPGAVRHHYRRHLLRGRTIFSDGQIAQAIDDVVTSNVLAGKKVVYFSAAGNNGNYAYASDFQRVTPHRGKWQPTT